MVEHDQRQRVSLEDRVQPGHQVGTCIFPMTADRLCGNPVYAKSIHGAKPKFCGQMVEGPDGFRVEHNGKTAAAARDRLGLRPDDVKRMAAATAEKMPTPTPTPSEHRRERALSSVPDLPELPVEDTSRDQTEETIPEGQTFVTSEVQQSIPVIESAAVESEAEQGSVTESIDRVEHLVTRFEAIATLIKDASGTLAPEIAAALKVAAAAGAAEREIIEARRGFSEKLTRSEVARRLAEESAVESSNTQRRMAIERDQAVAAMRQAKEEAAAQVAEAQAELARVKEEAGAQVAQANSAAREAIDRAARADEDAAAAIRNAEHQVNAAEAARTRAEGEAEELRKQVTKLNAQITKEREEHRAETDRNEERHRKDTKELHDYYRGIVNDTQEMLRTAYQVTGRHPDGAPGVPASNPE